eukprot:CAMPEP_0168521146 /NCGR_PEP_ID=MMETSP0405-20121227/8476_1 /TAXON_ID=498012 /ORGANISM="Trichosphaerium sp, Strain Am-I-7 wt" /LENGTH=198 /DNA_ID=CAMNT_0008542297 /DNA_START=1 /DNA_END=594 /DNA_ORIENTATION=-
MSTSSGFYKKAAWDVDAWTKGVGYVCEGKLVADKFHTITTKTDIVRYTAIVLDITDGRLQRRVYNNYQNEQHPQWDKPSDVRLTFDAFKKELEDRADTPDPKDILSSKDLHPTVKGRFEFLCPIDKAKNLKLKVGIRLTIYTKGPFVFIDRVRSNDMSEFSHLEGGEVMNQISQLSNQMEHEDPLPQDEMDGVDEDEW